MENNELRLCRKIYDLKDITFSVNSYAGIADILIQQEESYIICKFTNCIYDLTKTMQEFENYLIQYSNSKGYTQ